MNVTLGSTASNQDAAENYRYILIKKIDADIAAVNSGKPL